MNHDKVNNKYDKIKHLVEVDDDILAVFIIASSQIEKLYVAKNAHIDIDYVRTILNELGSIIGGSKSLEPKLDYESRLGKLRWLVIEYDKIRILKIHEDNRVIFVLINSNTQLEHTVDNILGYYLDLDETPKNLF
ncbi:MAG TPA: hypothetical protein VJR94_05560 [Candidatus Nitrosocosmicus sp.]|nr:hypothetical protein [Candidatus Nitrosocosmicus sp.]